MTTAQLATELFVRLTQYCGVMEAAYVTEAMYG